MFFYLGIHLELAVCALFYDLEGEENSSLEQDLASNFWVGLLSVLLAFPFLLAVSLCFRMKKKELTKLIAVSSIE